MRGRGDPIGAGLDRIGRGGGQSLHRTPGKPKQIVALIPGTRRDALIRLRRMKAVGALPDEEQVAAAIASTPKHQRTAKGDMDRHPVERGIIVIQRAPRIIAVANVERHDRMPIPAPVLYVDLGKRGILGIGKRNGLTPGRASDRDDG